MHTSSTTAVVLVLRRLQTSPCTRVVVPYDTYQLRQTLQSVAFNSQAGCSLRLVSCWSWLLYHYSIQAVPPWGLGVHYLGAP